MNFPKRGISIDIGNEKIKIVQYIKVKEKIKIVNALLLDTPDSTINDGQLLEVATLSDVIGEALKSINVKTKNVVFTVSSSKIIIREVDLPDLSKKKLNMLAKVKAEEHFPVDLDDYTVDYTIIDHMEVNGDKQVKVNLVAALTKVIEGYVEIAQNLNLKIAGIDYSGNSIVNFAKRISEERTYMLLDLGCSSTMVTIMNQGVPKFNRSLLFGTKLMSSSIENHFGVGYKEAIKISTEQALLNSEPEGNDYLSSEVSAALNQLLNGVSRLMDYYGTRNKENIDCIILVGGGTSIAGISDYIEHYFNIETRVITKENLIVEYNEKLEEQLFFFANTIGTIYSSLNLVPKSILQKKRKRDMARWRLELVIGFILIGAGLIYFPYSSLKSLEAEKERLLIEKAEKEVIVPIKDNYTSVFDTYKYYDEVIKGSTSQEPMMVAVLETMEENIPTDVSYISMNHTQDALVIQCIADEKLDLVQFIAQLKALEIDDQPLFSSVFVPSFVEVQNPESAVDEKDIYYSFSISCNYYIKEVQ